MSPQAAACSVVVLAASIAVPAFGQVAAPLTITNPFLDLPGYGIQWSDEFSANATLKEEWSIRKPGERRGGYNSMDQVSLVSDVDNLLTPSLNMGALQLTTKPPGTGADPSIPSNLYPTAMLSTHQSVAFTYGYFEAKIKLQNKTGNWSAFWLQSVANSDNIGLSTPNPGLLGTEIDIMEHRIVSSGRETNHALHWNGYQTGYHQTKHYNSTVPVDPDGFNTFGLLWTPDYYAFYINGVLSRITTEAISHAPEYLILSLEVSDSGSFSWGGTPTPANFPDYLYVDYVRVYQSARNITAIPEPATLALASTAVAALGLRRRRQAT